VVVALAVRVSVAMVKQQRQAAAVIQLWVQTQDRVAAVAITIRHQAATALPE
jgi:hypothetical protein